MSTRFLRVYQKSEIHILCSITKRETFSIPRREQEWSVIVIIVVFQSVNSRYIPLSIHPFPIGPIAVNE